MNAKKRKITCKHLSIREAIVNGRKYTPSQYDKLTGKGKAQKDNNYIPKDPAGHELIFVPSHKRNAFGKVIHVVSHFKHKHDNDNNCGYLQKYGSKPESEEHFQTKLFIANKKPSFLEKCIGSTCKHYKVTTIPENWVAKTEVKIEHWFMDVVFYKDGIIQMVVEIYHTHSIKGKKREYLMSQDYLYFEVKTQYSIDVLDNSEKLAFDVWDCKSDFLCGATCCLTQQLLIAEERLRLKKEQERKERLYKEQEEQVINTWKMFVRKILYKMVLHKLKFISFYKKWNYFYKKIIIKTLFHYVRMKNIRKQEDEYLKSEELRIKNQEKRKKRDEYLKSQEQGRQSTYRIYNEKKEAQNRSFIVSWKNAPLNKKLSNECNLVFKHGRFKGCHYLLVCYICPSEINNVIKSKSCCPIYYQCEKILQGRKLREYGKSILVPGIKPYILNRKVIDDFLNNNFNYI